MKQFNFFKNGIGMQMAALGVLMLSLVAFSEGASAVCSSGSSSKVSTLSSVDPVTKRSISVVGTVTKKATWTQDRKTGACLA